MATISRSGPAERDILQIWHYIAADSAEAADRVVEQIASAIQSLGEFPLRGMETPQYGVGLRKMVAGKYLIFYRMRRQDEVLVLRVLHGARNLKQVFRRRKK